MKTQLDEALIDRQDLVSALNEERSAREELQELVLTLQSQKATTISYSNNSSGDHDERGDFYAYPNKFRIVSNGTKAQSASSSSDARQYVVVNNTTRKSSAPKRSVRE